MCVCVCVSRTCSVNGCLLVGIVPGHGRGAVVQQQGHTLLVAPGAGQAEGGAALWAAGVHLQQGGEQDLQGSAVAVVRLHQGGEDTEASSDTTRIHTPQHKHTDTHSQVQRADGGVALPCVADEICP